MSEEKHGQAQAVCLKDKIEGQQFDLFEGRRRPSNLDQALWSRRQSRRDHVVIEGMTEEDRLLVPLILSIARLSAQRDARMIGGVGARPGTAHS